MFILEGVLEKAFLGRKGVGRRGVGWRVLLFRSLEKVSFWVFFVFGYF